MGINTLIHTGCRDTELTKGSPGGLCEAMVLFFVNSGEKLEAVKDYEDLNFLVPDEIAYSEVREAFGDIYLAEMGKEMPDSFIDEFVDGQNTTGKIEIDLGSMFHYKELREEKTQGQHDIQRIRTELARRMGFLALCDIDEQGEVISIDFTDREDLFNDTAVYVGPFLKG